MMRSTYSASELMKLGEPEFISVIDDNSISARDIDPRLYYCRADKYCKPLMIEIRHYSLKISFPHLTMSEINSSLRDQFLNILSYSGNRLHIIMEKIHLTSPKNFS